MAYALRKQDLPDYSYSDYVKWEGRWELISGIPYAMSPSPIFFTKIYSELVTLFRNALRGCKKCKATIFFDWKIDDKTVVQPDMLVICKPLNHKEFLDFAPELAVEILSPSSRHRDTNIKFKLFENEGVHYMISVDPENKSIQVYENGADGFTKLKANGLEYNFDLSGSKIQINLSGIWQ